MAGVDANHNGVRDDVERYIGTHFDNDEKVMRLVTNMAISTQYALVSTTERESAKAHSLDIRAQECAVAALDSVGPYIRELTEFAAMLMDTPQREEAWQAYLHRLKELYYANHFSPTWDEGCMKRVDDAYEPGGMDSTPRRD